MGLNGGDSSSAKSDCVGGVYIPSYSSGEHASIGGVCPMKLVFGEDGGVENVIKGGELLSLGGEFGMDRFMMKGGGGIDKKSKHFLYIFVLMWLHEK